MWTRLQSALPCRCFRFKLEKGEETHPRYLSCPCDVMVRAHFAAAPAAPVTRANTNDLNTTGNIHSAATRTSMRKKKLKQEIILSSGLPTRGFCRMSDSWHGNRWKMTEMTRFGRKFYLEGSLHEIHFVSATENHERSVRREFSEQTQFKSGAVHRHPGHSPAHWTKLQRRRNGKSCDSSGVTPTGELSIPSDH